MKQKVTTPVSHPQGQGCESGLTEKAVVRGPWFVHTVLTDQEEWGCCCFVFGWYIDIPAAVKDKDLTPFESTCFSGVVIQSTSPLKKAPALSLSEV